MVARIVKAGGRAVAIGADLANVDDCRRLLEQTAMSLGAPDIFVNNAGFSLERLVLDTRVDEWDALMKVHLRALFLLSKVVLPAMIRRGWGRIVVISSIWGMVERPMSDLCGQGRADRLCQGFGQRSGQCGYYGQCSRAGRGGYRDAGRL